MCAYCVCYGWALLSPSNPHDISHVTPSILSKDLPSAGWASMLYSSQSSGKRSREEEFPVGAELSKISPTCVLAVVSWPLMRLHIFPTVFLARASSLHLRSHNWTGGLLPAAPSPRRLWATVGFCIVSSLRTSGKPVVPGMSLYCPNCCYFISSFLGFWLQGAA